MRGGGAVDKHATTNVHKTRCLLQMSGEKEAEKNDPSSVLSASSQLGNYSLALLTRQGGRE